jgi:hypothetical protein
VSLLNYYRCIACRKKAKINKAIGHHSLPFGHGDVWCSEKCFNSNKIAKLDKRNIRSQNRRWGKIWKNLN